MDRLHKVRRHQIISPNAQIQATTHVQTHPPTQKTNLSGVSEDAIDGINGECNNNNTCEMFTQNKLFNKTLCIGINLHTEFSPRSPKIEIAFEWETKRKKCENGN